MAALRTSALAVCALLILTAPGAAGTPQDGRFAESVYASGLSQLTSMAWAGDGSSTLFLAQKNGQVRVVRDGVLQAAAFASLSVFTSSECGLVGLAADPSYASNKHVWVFATTSSTEQKILRYTATTDGGGNLVASGAPVQVGPTLPCRGVNHDGGALVFGPDGHLYFGVGNLGNGNNVGGNGTSTEFTSLASKIGRMDRNGNAVSTNPYYDAGDGISARDYIFARGMRNPYGLRFHPTTGALWLTMVGDQYEQVFTVPRDGNAGWPTENNASTTNGLLVPKLAYRTNQHEFGGCITRGAFYTGAAFPAEFRNNFFFCDYNADKIVRCVLNGAGDAIQSASVFVTGATDVTDVSTGPDGALYYAGFGGTVWRLRHAVSQNIVVSTNSLSVPEGQSRTFTVRLASAPAATATVSIARSSGSTDVTVSPASLAFTASTWSTPQTVTVSAAQDADAVNESATVSCSSPGLATQAVNVSVSDDDASSGAPVASITAPRNGDTVSGTTAEFYGDGLDDVGTVRAEFYVDGVLRYTDVDSSGHYHYGGDHLLWDTTALTDGPHTLLMRVYDAQGQSGSHQIGVVVDNASPPTGLRAEYFDNADLSVPVLTRTDAVVDFAWGNGSPDAAVAPDTFSVRWTGQVQAEFSETYTFHATTDDGVRLWVGGTLIIDRWVNQAPTTSTGSIALTAGQRADLRMEYYESGGGASAKLEWSSPSRARQVVPQARLYPAVLPLPWTTSDVGSPSKAGSASHAGGAFTVDGGGADIWGTADAFRFVRQRLGGDFTLTARVTSVQNTHGWAKAGVMAREGLGAVARHAMMVVTPGNGTAFQRRASAGGTSASTSGPSLLAPAWVRLVRSGSTFSGYASSDGAAWTLVGSQTIATAVDLHVGLAVTSHDDAKLCRALFTNVSLTGTAYRQDAGADGLVVMEAERFHAKADQGGHGWSSVAAPSGYAGTGALQATPNNGANVNTGYVTGSPRLDFRVNFLKAGTHHVWVRGAGATGSDDSVHVGLDGAASATSDRLSSFQPGWTWSRATMDGPSAVIEVPTAGLHTVNVWMREDGFVIDRLLLSTSAVYGPSGSGPPESPR